MSLLSILRKAREERLATATPAIAATQPKREAAAVATIATVAVANPKEVNIPNAVNSWGRLLHFADRDPRKVHCNLDATRPAILDSYPDALAAGPIPERTRRNPPEAEAVELRALVLATGKAEKWTADEIEWAMATALADPDGARICYRQIALEHGIIRPLDDDRRTCNQCANLAGRRCLAAWRGDIVASAMYEPIRDLPRRCEGYMPGSDDSDRRPGVERWLGLRHSAS
ncbi:MAG: hypothetical protein MUE59_00095 [Thiobacillaceae bacterium]|jgi:hypothetical protein|nr:hypothetical protein [Thiobacillaceae bacterium]